MTATTFAVNDPLSNKLWAKKLNVEALKQTYFGKFMGVDSTNMIQVKTEPDQNAGDNVTIGLRVQMQGAGVTEGQTLVGNEEGLATFNDQLKINELAHAARVRNKQTIDAQRVPFNLRNEAKLGLTDWFADRFDSTMANHLAGNTAITDARFNGNNPITPATNIFRGTVPSGAAPVSRTADELVVAGDIFTLGIIDILVERANTISPLIRPIIVNGEKKFVMFLHDFQVTDMRTNTSSGQWLDIQKAALAGGASTKSPIYSGALGEYNNVILHKWNRLPNGINSTTGAPVPNTKRAVLCGAQAGAVGFGKEFAKGSHYKWIEELFDYERELGVSAQTVWGLKKSVFNAKDFGTVVATTFGAPK